MTFHVGIARPTDSSSSDPVITDQLGNIAPRPEAALAALLMQGDFPKKPGGRWLSMTLARLWGTPRWPNGLSAASQNTGVSRKTLATLRDAPPPFPRQTTVDHLAQEITRRAHEIKRPDLAVTREQIMREFGWTQTFEEVQRATCRRCPICDKPLTPGQTYCGRGCAALDKILDGKFRTDGGRLIFTIMAIACRLAVERIASLVDRPLERVRSWTGRRVLLALVSAIKKQQTSGQTLFHATRWVLKVGSNTLTRLLHGLYRPEGKKRRRAQRFTRRVDLAARLGMDYDEYLRMFQLERPRRAATSVTRSARVRHPKKKTRRPCRVCEAPAPRHGRPYCGELHSNLWRVIQSLTARLRHRRLFETHQRFAVLVMLGCGLKVDQISSHLGIPRDTAAGWATESLVQTAAKIRDARGDHPAVIPPVARVFGWGIATVERYPYNRVFRKDRKRPPVLSWPRIEHIKTLADALGVTEKACQDGLRALGTWEDFGKSLHEASTRSTKSHRRRTGTVGRRGPLPVDCTSVRAAVALGMELGRMPSTKEMAERGIVWPLGQRPRAFLTMHSRRCRDCGGLVAAFFHHYLGESKRRIARLTLRADDRTVRRMIAQWTPRLSRPWDWAKRRAAPTA